MAIVRIEAIRALAQLIATAIPQLNGKICDGPPPSSEHEQYPSLAIQPARWAFEVEQAIEQRTLPGNVVVWNVGQHVSPMVLSLITATQQERYELEASILDLFLSSRHPLTGMHRPGVLVLPISACPDLGDWLASFEMESDEWNDAAMMDRRYESRIVLTAIVPALTIERPVYSINELQLAITQDMNKVFTPATAIPPDVELVTINQDGTISPAT